MPTFFQRWRRQLGMVTLLIALAFMAAWARSRNVEDLVTTNPFGRLHVIVSAASMIAWCGCPDGQGLHLLNWTAESFDQNQRRNILPYSLLVKVTPQQSEELEIKYWIIPYYSIVIPLTLLSAYLMLSKPRPKISATR